MAFSKCRVHYKEGEIKILGGGIANAVWKEAGVGTQGVVGEAMLVAGMPGLCEGEQNETASCSDHTNCHEYVFSGVVKPLH